MWLGQVSVSSRVVSGFSEVLIMRQVRPDQSIGFGILLIAIAIQGVTPDAHDLGSTRSLQLLGLIPQGVERLADGDGTPDEVCGAARYLAGGSTIVIPGELPETRLAPPSYVRSPSPTVSGRDASNRGYGGTIDRDFDLLCRLIC
jgi:hypothetical protein